RQRGPGLGWPERRAGRTAWSPPVVSGAWVRAVRQTLADPWPRGQTGSYAAEAALIVGSRSGFGPIQGQDAPPPCLLVQAPIETGWRFNARRVAKGVVCDAYRRHPPTFELAGC